MFSAIEGTHTNMCFWVHLHSHVLLLPASPFEPLLSPGSIKNKPGFPTCLTLNKSDLHLPLHMEPPRSANIQFTHAFVHLYHHLSLFLLQKSGMLQVELYISLETTTGVWNLADPAQVLSMSFVLVWRLFGNSGEMLWRLTEVLEILSKSCPTVAQPFCP